MLMMPHGHAHSYEMLPLLCFLIAHLSTLDMHDMSFLSVATAHLFAEVIANVCI